MKSFKPNIYVKDVFNINYDRLKSMGIKLLLFDLDNTLISKNKKLELKSLFNRISNMFEIIIVSNTIHTKKISLFSKEHNIKFIMASRKPLKYGFNKVKFYYEALSNETCLIGDQLITDIYGGNRMGYYTILVDPLEKEELIFTKINRFFETRIFKKNNFKRGDYYD